jgi:hypothetical protein
LFGREQVGVFRGDRKISEMPDMIMVFQPAACSQAGTSRGTLREQGSDNR